MAGVAMLCALVLDLFVCNIVLKPLVARIRPFDVNTAVQLLIARPTDYSFPSGHTTAAFAATSALYFSRRRLWIPALALAALIAFSRLYLYVHYPTDILAGIVVGIGVGYLGWRAAETLSGSWKRRKNSK
jgi:undecaprenyl-diphosphatase